MANQSNPDLIGRHTHQMIDLQALFSPITKRTTELTAENSGFTAGFALALNAGRPTLIDALIDPISYPTTPST